MIHLNALLALAAALLWGGADFSGGMGVGAAGGKIGSALRVVMLSHISSFSVLLAIVLLRREPMPHGALLAWGLLAGFCGGVSLTCFYMALSRGAMGASAAVSGLLAAAIPAFVSMAVEGAPTTLRIAGFLLAATAIWMIAAGPSQQHAARSTMVLAIIAGIGFGVYFVALRMANPLGIFMPMALARVGSLITCGLTFLFLASRDTTSRGDPSSARSLRLRWEFAGNMTGKAVLWALAAGTLDTTGNLLFIAATRAGRLDVAAVLASLYPASTIVLAGWLLHERLARRQWLGIGVAACAVVMITV
ncbi:MAG TPA: EamA family transporter [Acidobacteriaceae bacterium]